MAHSQPPNRTYAEHQQQLSAMRILESHELLVWHSAARNESVAQTRLYYLKLLGGFNPDTPPPQWRDVLYGERKIAAAAAGASASPSTGPGGAGARAEAAAAAATAAAAAKAQTKAEQERKKSRKRARVSGVGSEDGRR